MSQASPVHPLLRLSSLVSDGSIEESLNKTFEYDPVNQISSPWKDVHHHLDPFLFGSHESDLLMQASTTGSGNGQSGVDPQ